MLNKRAGKTSLLWMPGHHGIAGNEEADFCAKQATAITDGALPIIHLHRSQRTYPPNTNGPTALPL